MPPLFRLPSLCLGLTLLGLLSLAAGCVSADVDRRTCALVIVADGGRRTVTREEKALVEKRMTTALEDMGLVFRRDATDAAFVAHVVLQSDLDHPSAEPQFAIRRIVPNPQRARYQVPPGPTAEDAQLRRDMARDEREFSNSK